MRSMVEGCVRPSSAYDRPRPSTTLRVVPLPTATPQGGLGNDRNRPKAAIDPAAKKALS